MVMLAAEDSTGAEATNELMAIELSPDRGSPDQYLAYLESAIQAKDVERVLAVFSSILLDCQHDLLARIFADWLV